MIFNKSRVISMKSRDFLISFCLNEILQMQKGPEIKINLEISKFRDFSLISRSLISRRRIRSRDKTNFCQSRDFQPEIITSRDGFSRFISHLLNNLEIYKRSRETNIFKPKFNFRTRDTLIEIEIALSRFFTRSSRDLEKQSRV